MGVDFVSLREGFDLNTPAGRMMAGVLTSVAVYETEVRQERQTAGIQKAKEEGKYKGGKKGRVISLTEEKQELILQLRGKPIAKIARLVGVSRPSVYAVLRKAG